MKGKTQRLVAPLCFSDPIKVGMFRYGHCVEVSPIEREFNSIHAVCHLREGVTLSGCIAWVSHN